MSVQEVRGRGGREVIREIPKEGGGWTVKGFKLSPGGFFLWTVCYNMGNKKPLNESITRIVFSSKP